MSHHLYGRLCGWLLLASLLGISKAAAQTVAPAPAGKAAPETGQVFVTGVVKLKPKDATEYCPISNGTAFRRGDLLQVVAPGKAVIVCADGSKYERAAGTHGLPCAPPKAASSVVIVDGVAAKVSYPRGEQNQADFPRIVSPRKTKLLDAQPLLRWLPLAGATHYLVSVRGPHLDWRVEVRGQTELAYPKDKDKQLQPGASYQLIVAAGEASSASEELPGFTLLTDAQAQPIRTAAAQIRALSLPDAATRLLLAQLYAAHELHAEALELLREGAAQEPVAARQLGDLYFNSGLARLAEAEYGRALKLARQREDLPNQAHAHYRLGQVYESYGNVAEMRKAWQQAAALYQTLNDAEMKRRIAGDLALYPEPR